MLSLSYPRMKRTGLKKDEFPGYKKINLFQKQQRDIYCGSHPGSMRGPAKKTFRGDEHNISRYFFEAPGLFLPLLFLI